MGTSLVISGMPRCGSTLLFHAVRNHMRSWKTHRGPKHTWHPHIDYVHNPTYQIPIAADAKAIITFGNVVNSVLSTSAMMRKSKKWGTMAAKIFDVSRVPPDAIYDDDHYGFYPLILEWLVVRDRSVMFLRYETLYRHLDSIAAFLNYPDFELPPWKPRSTDHTTADQIVVKRIEDAYQDLIQLVDVLPDCFIIQPEEPE